MKAIFLIMSRFCDMCLSSCGQKGVLSDPLTRQESPHRASETPRTPCAEGTGSQVGDWPSPAPSPRLTHRSLHHVGLAVPQGLHRVEHVHDVLPLHHFHHDADGTEHATPPATVSKTNDIKGILESRFRWLQAT